jgi:hypothetical protein
MPGLLELGEARGEAMRQLSDLVEQRAELERRLSQVDADQRAASEEVQRAAAALVDLEERSASGEEVSGAERKRAEDRLAKARSRHGQPWAERLAGIQAALRRHDDATSRYIGANLDELIDELDAEAERVAEAVNEAANVLVAAYHGREAHSERATALCALAGGGRVRPGDVARSRAEAVARAATKLLEGGGEPPPVVVHRPGQPRHGREHKADREAEFYAPEPAA